jgi:uncharacterized protein (TIGR02271 family)
MTMGAGMGSSTQRTITAFFDSRDDAEDAIDRLVGIGISRDSIRFMPGNERDSDTATTTSSTSGSGEGFWDSLRDLFLPDEDRSTYAEGLRRGGYLISVNATDAHYERVLDILDDEGTIDLDDRADTWRSEGWTGSTLGGTSGSGTSGDMTSGDMTSGGMTSGGTGLRSTGLGSTTSGGTGAGLAGSGVGSAGMSGTTASLDTGAGSTTDTTGFGAGRTTATGSMGTASGDMRDRDEEVIPVAEEQIRVGKRDVSHGRVRVRSYIVETPVNEAVNLREEHVHVERRPVDRSLSDADRAFQERTIEAEERGEEAVVSKEARVTEELVIRKDVEERTENVSDTVRTTKVEVEDERGNAINRDGTTDRR